MEGIPPDDPDTREGDARLQGCFPILEHEEDKKTLLWMGGVMNCFSNVLAFFSQTDLQPQGKFVA